MLSVRGARAGPVAHTKGHHGTCKHASMRGVTGLMRSHTIEYIVMALCSELQDTKTRAIDVTTCAHYMPLLHDSTRQCGPTAHLGLEAHAHTHMHNQSLPTAHRTAIALEHHGLGGAGRYMSI